MGAYLIEMPGWVRLAALALTVALLARIITRGIPLNSHIGDGP
jgi:hypothetical protein